MGFQHEFESLPLPKTRNEYSFSAVAIRDFKSHRIGKDYKGNPCILVSVIESDQGFKVARQKLYNLSITHNLNCEIHFGTTREERNFSVIRYSGDDQDLKGYFLEVCEFLVPSLGVSPSNKQITYTVNKFIELFKVLNEPPRSLSDLANK